MRFSVRLLIALLATGLISIAFLALIFFQLLGRQTDEEINLRLGRSRQAVMNQVEVVEEKAIAQAEALNDHPAIISTLKETDAHRHLREIAQIKAETDLDILQIVDRAGLSQLSLINTLTRGKDQSRDPLFQKAIGGSGAVGLTFDEDLGLHIIAALPIRENGQLLGVLQAGYFFDEELLLKLKRLIEMDLTVYPPGELITTTLVDQRGGYYSQRPSPTVVDRLAQQQSYQEEFRFAGRSYRSIYLNLYEDLRFLGPVTTIEDGGNNPNLGLSTEGEPSRRLATLMVSLPIDYALAVRANTLRILLMYTALVGLLAVITSFILSKAVTRRLDDLAWVADKVSRGNLTVRADEQSQDEFGRVARAFNRMVADIKSAMYQLEKDSELLLRRDFDLVTLTQKLDQNNIELKKTIASLETANRKNDILLGNIGDGVLAINHQGQVIHFNQALGQLTRVVAQRALGQPLDQILNLRETHGARISFDYLTKRLTERKQRSLHLPDVTLEYRRGRKVFLDLVVSPIESPIEDLRGFMIVFHNISEEKELERMKLDFVSMAAHELRTPITSIRGYLEVFLAEVTDKLTAEQKMMINRVKLSSNRLLALVENILNVSKIEQGKLSVNIGPHVIETLIQQATEELTEEAHEKGLRLIYQPPKERLPLVAFDPLGIREVLNNLLVNAIAYTQAPGKVVADCRYDPATEMVITRVRDTGQGIPPESLPHMFQKFYRVTGILEQGSKGTGLGLYISKAIIDLHQGKIWVESELGQGSTFYFALPIAR